MKRKTFQLHIPEPCREDWQKMTPTEIGRFCQSCEKTVVDFTQMTDRELARFYQKNSGKLCGRFQKDQLNRDLHFNLKGNSSNRLSWAALLFFGLLSTQAAQAQEVNTFIPLPVVQNEEVIPAKQEVRGEVVDKEQTTTFQGRVIDAETKDPLIGVTLILEGSTIGTVTDMDGKFTLHIPPEFGIPIVQIHYTGYSLKTLVLDQEMLQTSQIVKLGTDQMTTMGSIALTGEVVITRPSTLYNKIRSLINYYKYTTKEERKEFRMQNREERRKAKAAHKTEKMACSLANDSTEEKVITLPLFTSEINMQELELDSSSPTFGISNVFPNPYQQTITVVLEIQQKQTLTLSLYGPKGKVVIQQKEIVEPGENQIQLTNIPKINGQTTLHILDEAGQSIVQQLIQIQK